MSEKSTREGVTQGATQNKNVFFRNRRLPHIHKTSQSREKNNKTSSTQHGSRRLSPRGTVLIFPLISCHHRLTLLTFTFVLLLAGGRAAGRLAPVAPAVSVLRLHLIAWLGSAARPHSRCEPGATRPQPVAMTQGLGRAAGGGGRGGGIKQGAPAYFCLQHHIFKDVSPEPDISLPSANAQTELT